MNILTHFRFLAFVALFLATTCSDNERVTATRRYPNQKPVNTNTTETSDQEPGGNSTPESGDATTTGENGGDSTPSTPLPEPTKIDVEKIPQALFTSPEQFGMTVDKEATLTVDLRNMPDTATWSLFFARSRGSTEIGEEIKSKIPAQTKTFTWDTSSLGDGDYFLFATIEIATQSYRYSAAGIVTVKH